MFDREIKRSASASAEQRLVFQVPLVEYEAFDFGGCQDGDPAVTEASEIDVAPCDVAGGLCDDVVASSLNS